MCAYVRADFVRIFAHAHKIAIKHQAAHTFACFYPTTKHYETASVHKKKSACVRVDNWYAARIALKKNDRCGGNSAAFATFAI